jgi:hypothetical protein
MVVWFCLPKFLDGDAVQKSAGRENVTVGDHRHVLRFELVGENMSGRGIREAQERRSAPPHQAAAHLAVRSVEHKNA